jgi:hypothetical protein
VSRGTNEILTEEGAAAEQYELPDDLPDHVKVSRPNLGKPTVVSVRLSDKENRRLQRASKNANLPVSTLIRIWALDRLKAEEQGGGASTTERLARLEKAVFDQTG